MELIPARWQKHFKGPAKLSLQAVPEIKHFLSENLPFPPETARDEQGLMVLRVEGKGQLEFKLPAGNIVLGGDGEVCGLLDLVWPDEPAEVLSAMGFQVPLPPDRVAIMLLLSGQLRGDAALDSLAATAGEFRPELRYARIYPRDMGSRDMLEDFLNRFQSPLRLSWPQTLVDEHSRVTLGRQGALNFDFALGAESGWIGAWPLQFFHLSVNFAAESGVAGHLEGHFQHGSGYELQLRPSTLGPEWLQAELRLGQGYRSELSGGFEAWARIGARDAGDGLEGWLKQLLGLDVARLLDVLRGLAEAGRAPEGPRTGLHRLIMDEVFEPQLAELENRLTETDALARLTEAIARLRNLDGEIRRLVLRHIGHLDRVRVMLTGLADAAELAQLSLETVHWLTGQGIQLEDLFRSPERLEKWRQGLAGLLEPDNWRLTERLGQRLKAVATVRRALDDLAKLAEPGAWLARADQRLRGWAEFLLGRALDEIPPASLQRLLDASAWVAGHFDTLSQRLDRAVGTTFDRYWQVAVGLAYARSQSDDRLVTAEFNLRSPQGLALFRSFASGDLTAAWSPQGAGKVHLTAGRFLRELHRSLSWDFQLGPLGIEILESLVVKQSLDLRAVGSGWQQEMTLSAKGLVEHRRQDDTYFQSALEVMAEARRILPAPDLQGAWAWPEFRAFYALNAQDPVTRPQELRLLLELAERMRLLGGKSPAEIVDAILGTDPPYPVVKLSYLLRLPATLLPALWSQPQVRDRISQAVLDILEWSYLRHGTTTSWLRVLGGAINAPDNRATFHRRGHLRGLPCHAQLGPAQGKRRRHLVRLGELEQRKLESLYRIADSAGALFQDMANRCQTGPLTPDGIEQFSRELAAFHNRLARWGLRLDTFPHLLAVLARRAGLFHQVSAALELEVTEPETGKVSRWIFTPMA